MPSKVLSSWKRAPRAELDEVPTANIPTNPIPEDFDADKIFESIAASLSQLRAEQLDDQAFWRDILALTGTWRHLHGSVRVASEWNELVALRQLSNFTYVRGSAHAARIGSGGFVPGRFTFDIGGDWVGTGSAIVALYPHSNGDWKIWFLSTFLESVDGLGSPDVLEPVVQTNGSITNGHHANGVRGEASPSNGINGHRHPEEFDVAIVGAGQGGLSTLGRLKAIGLKALALESHDTIGGNWTSRYDGVKLHTSRYYSNFPFGKHFNSEELPYFLRPQNLARGFQQYVADYGLDVRLSSRVEYAKWDEDTQRWTVTVNTEGKEWSLRAKHIVFAIGTVGAFPARPEIPNEESYRGTAVHSTAFKNAIPWAGKKGIVVGTGNTAHDVAEDMVDSGLTSVTMTQRTRTMVIPMQVFKPLHSRLYHADADLASSDRAEWGLPFPVQGAVSKTLFGHWRKTDPALYDGLESQGFKTEIPNLVTIHNRSGGHYIDVGAAQKIIDGKIHIKNGLISSFTPNGLRFKDGSEIEADLIVFATGFNVNIRNQVAAIVGNEIGELLEDSGGFDLDGELRGGWKPQGHPKLWYTAGEFGQCRFYSRFLALQIKADIEGRRFQEWKD
ncbi:hypothetical protein CKM354_001066100 [Cercospora kikuchii]|uniref:Flavin-containing monooxygenase n=1 Tax=Cercospora kikuchii TaxID=84275 RepID=A0A9P3CRF6_9PEZI|nr:uncharacterized protein CKM354_001066100 [Cercospora kikuchii]GIZ47573.1 hypothetical protein CKM354_001066100 [Cercospora kikuchii]